MIDYCTCTVMYSNHVRHFKKIYCVVHSAQNDVFFPWITVHCTVTIIYMTIFYGFFFFFFGIETICDEFFYFIFKWVVHCNNLWWFFFNIFF
jgi:hypothetical protein